MSQPQSHAGMSSHGPQNQAEENGGEAEIPLLGKELADSNEVNKKLEEDKSQQLDNFEEERRTTASQARDVEEILRLHEDFGKDLKHSILSLNNRAREDGEKVLRQEKVIKDKEMEIKILETRNCEMEGMHLEKEKAAKEQVEQKEKLLSEALAREEVLKKQVLELEHVAKELKKELDASTRREDEMACHAQEMLAVHTPLRRPPPNDDQPPAFTSPDLTKQDDCEGPTPTKQKRTEK